MGVEKFHRPRYFKDSVGGVAANNSGAPCVLGRQSGRVSPANLLHDHPSHTDDLALPISFLRDWHFLVHLHLLEVLDLGASCPTASWHP